VIFEYSLGSVMRTEVLLTMSELCCIITLYQNTMLL